MAETNVQVAPNSTGSKIDSFSVTSAEAGNPTVLRQAVVLGDPSTAANVATVTASGALKVDNSGVTQPVSGTFWQATQPVSIATNTPDVTDRSTRLLGHVTVDNSSIAVTGTFWQATQPVSIATNTPDVTDRSARLLGHVTVDNASIAVTGTFWQATQPVSQSGTWTVQPGNTANSTPWLVVDSADGTVAAGTAAAKSMLGGLVYNTTAPAPTNGQQMALQSDLAGNLKTAFGIASYTGSALTTTLNATQVLVSNAGSPFVIVQLVQTTTITAGAINFEVTYDDINWVTIPNAQVVDPSTLAQISLPYTLQANTNKPFLIILSGARQLRIKTSTAITGTGNVTPYVTELAYDPIPQINTSGALKVDGSAVTQPVSGTFWQATQPVSIATNTPDVTDRSARLLGHVTVDNASLAVTGTFWQATQPVSIATNTPDVTDRAGRLLGVVASITNALPTGSNTIGAVTGPSAAALALDATLTGGTQKSIVRGGAKGSTSAADVTSTSVDANTQALHTNVTNSSIAVTGTFWQATQPVSLATNTPDVTDRSGRLLGHVTVDNASLAVTGTFWQATQPVSIAATVAVDTELTTADLDTGAGTDTRAVVGLVLAKSGGAVNISTTDPLPVTQQGTVTISGAVTQSGTWNSRTQDGSGNAITSTSSALDVNVKNTSLAVTGTFWQATQPVSIATNTPDVTDRAARLLGVVASITNALPTGSNTLGAVTAPGAVALALDSTLTGGTLKSIVRGGAKGSTTAADVTSSASGANHQPLDVAIYDASGNQITSFGGTVTDTVLSGSITAANANLNSGTATAGSTVVTGTLNSVDTISVQLTGTLVGTLLIQVSNDNANWISIAQAQNVNTAQLTANITANGIYVADIAGFQYVRVTASAYTSGTGTITARLSTASAVNGLDAPLPTGSNVIGAVTQSGGPWTDNITQFGGTNIATGTGAGGAGIPRVTVSNDSNILATQSGIWNIGTLTGITNVVHIDDNSASLTVDAPVGTPVFARLSDGAAALIGQKTMANSLPVTISSDQASIPVAATLSAETTKVLGVVRTADGAGNLLLSAANALNSTGAGLLGVQIVAQFDDVSPTTITENQFGNLRMSTNRNLYGTIRDAAGNERGANVTAANELLVSVNNTSLAVTGTFWQATQPVSAPVGTPAYVRLSDGAANLIGQKSMANSLPVVLASDQSAIPTSSSPTTSGGLSISRTLAAASTNATSVKASAGQVYGWYITNTNAAARFVKLYNKASAPTVGTDTPVMTILIPGNTAGAGTNVEFSNGIAYGTGIAMAITTGVADADTGAVAANEIIVNLLYK